MKILVVFLSQAQSRTQFSLWALAGAPLLISGTVANMSDYTRDTYSNAEVIAVSQDVAGTPGTRVAGGDQPEAYTGPPTPCAA